MAPPRVHSTRERNGAPNKLQQWARLTIISGGLRNHWVRVSSSACHEVQSSGLKSTPARNTIRFLDNPRLAHYSFGFLANPASHPVRISLLKLRQEQLYR